MKTRKHFVSLLAPVLVVLAGIGVLAGIVSFRPPSTERLKADIRSQIPIGSTRPKVVEFMKAQGIEEALFDYHPGNPRQGTLIIGVVAPPQIVRTAKHICPWLEVPLVHLTFYFDHRGPDGKLTNYQVSDKRIPIAL
jgi:hypothetical protein